MNLEDNLNDTQSDTNILNDIPIRITVELGCIDIPLKQLNSFGEGSIVTLEQMSGEPVLLKANGEPVALGEVVVVDENFGVRVIEVLSEQSKKDYKYRKNIVPYGKIVKSERTDEREF